MLNFLKACHDFFELVWEKLLIKKPPRDVDDSKFLARDPYLEDKEPEDLKDASADNENNSNFPLLPQHTQHKSTSQFLEKRLSSSSPALIKYSSRNTFLAEKQRINKNSSTPQILVPENTAKYARIKH